MMVYDRGWPFTIRQGAFCPCSSSTLVPLHGDFDRLSVRRSRLGRAAITHTVSARITSLVVRQVKKES
jgi:hypothetical protein